MPFGAERYLERDGRPLVVKKQVVLRTKVELFPEGGNIVQGLEEKIAFKATHHPPIKLPISTNNAGSKLQTYL